LAASSAACTSDPADLSWGKIGCYDNCQKGNTQILRPAFHPV